MSNGNDALFDNVKRLMESKEMPDTINRKMQWAALSAIYEEQKVLRPVVTMTRNLRTGFRVLSVVVGFLVVTHLAQAALFAEALWKWFVAII